MTGDTTDIVSRLRTVLPTRWFPDETPILDAVLTGLATAWSSLYALLAVVRLQSRIATATDVALDGASLDYFGLRLRRRLLEPDAMFRARITRELVRDHATRSALATVVSDLTGTVPIIFEAARLLDTGAYNGPNLAYGVTGAWGSLSLPYQVFVTIRRQPTEGIAVIAGYGTAGPLARADLGLATGQVTDADIYAAVASVMPTVATAWTAITN